MPSLSWCPSPSRRSVAGPIPCRPDDALCRVIVEKFETLGRGRGGVSYADIAKRAWEVGRTALATRLLDYETKASDQVPLLLSMQEDKLALAKAVESGDTDLGKSM